jgi:hypothetical protein
MKRLISAAVTAVMLAVLVAPPWLRCILHDGTRDDGHGPWDGRADDHGEEARVGPAVYRQLPEGVQGGAYAPFTWGT